MPERRGARGQRGSNCSEGSEGRRQQNHSGKERMWGGSVGVAVAEVRGGAPPSRLRLSCAPSFSPAPSSSSISPMLVPGQPAKARTRLCSSSAVWDAKSRMDSSLVSWGGARLGGQEGGRKGGSKEGQ